MLGPWYVGDTPTAAIVVIVTRDGVKVQLDGYVSAAVVLHTPDGQAGTWAGTPTIDTATDEVSIPAPAGSPFARPGNHTLYVRLTTAGGAVETFRVADLAVFAIGVWPPTLDALKDDLKIDLADTRDDDRLASDLAAAVSFVERVRPDVQYDSFDPDQIDKPVPTVDHRLGTLRLAGRWGDRRRSPDGTISMGELGTSRVSTFDPDIDRMLRLGRHARARVG